VNKKNAVLIVLPARYGSTRFPGKVLQLLAGKPIVWWCYEAAVRAKVGSVLVATEDERVKKTVERLGGKAVLTPASCRSGTDRVREAAKGSKAAIVVNLQADEPLIDARTIRKTVQALEADPGADIGTAAAPITNRERVADPNTVKVVFDKRGRALYFTRSPVPFLRHPGAARGPTHWQHIGIYAFRKKALEKFVKLPTGRLEALESLEQLRAMENGMVLTVARVSTPTIGIDTPEDLRRVQALMS
jgi:3-deoxy-manno-octulosonate cytidylyltransferase (CMP-KDO synthetase)